MIDLKNNIARDTIFLTAMQLLTQCLSLILNVFVNRMLGTENLGLMSLINAFFTFVIIISNGNIFVSTSRFVAEECGKSDGNPLRIFKFSLIFSLALSTFSAVAVFIFSGPVSMRIIKEESSAAAIRMLSFSLPLAAVSSCIKGYFNAYRKVVIPALSETAAFLVRSCIMAVSAGMLIKKGVITIYTALAISTICSEVTGLLFLTAFALKEKHEKCTNGTVNFFRYAAGLIPIMLNSYIPCILSTANDALVPVTLKQSGCSTADALSKYGLFEAVVLPVLFFPSMLLSCLSTILIPEISKHRAGGNGIKNLDLISSVISKTIAYSLFIVSILAVFGNEIGMLVGHDEYAGKMIMMLAPVVPFIYLEIVLEGIIKGLGKHSFSSLNYLAEYIIRISALLICTPIIGFYGIAVSYYLSNIVCNIARIVVISKIYEMKFSLGEYLTAPLIAILIAWQCGTLADRIFGLENLGSIAQIGVYTVISLAVYLTVLKLLKRSGSGRQMQILEMKQNI